MALELLKEEFNYHGAPNASLLDTLMSKKRAAKRLKLVAKSIGEERSRNELMPLLVDLIVATREEDEILYIFSSQLDNEMAKLCGGGEHTKALIGPLELLANFEETLVREKAVTSINGILEQFSSAQISEYVVPMVKRLTEGEWFTPRISACSLLPAMFKKQQGVEKDIAQLVEMFVKLCNDETPMVRRQAAKVFGPTLDVEKKAIFDAKVQEQFLMVYKSLTQDAQNSVRILIISHTGAISKILGDDDVNSTLIPLVKQFANERSWRVRIIVTREIAKMCKHQPNFHDKLIPIFVQLLQDIEEDVRVEAIKELPNMHENIGFTKFIQLILPTMKALGDMDGEIPVSIRNALVDSSLAITKRDKENKINGAFKNMWEKYFTDTLSYQNSDVRARLMGGLGDIIVALGDEAFQWAKILRDLFEQSKAVKVNHSNEPTMEMEEVDTPKWRIRASIVTSLDLLASQQNAGSNPRKSFKKNTLTDGKTFAVELFKKALVDEVAEVRNACAVVLEKFMQKGSGFGGPSEVEKHIIPALKDVYSKYKNGNYSIRVSFVKTVGVLGANESLFNNLADEFLTCMKTDPVVNVRLCAVAVAKNCSFLKEHLNEVADNDEDEDVREAAR